MSIAHNTGPNTLSPRSKLAVTLNLQVLSLLANYWCCTLCYPFILFYDTTALFTSKSLILLHFLSETLESPFWLLWINFSSGLVCWANLENESPPLYKSHEICILYWPLGKESYLVLGKESHICNSPSIAWTFKLQRYGPKTHVTIEIWRKIEQPKPISHCSINQLRGYKLNLANVWSKGPCHYWNMKKQGITSTCLPLFNQSVGWASA